VSKTKELEIKLLTICDYATVAQDGKLSIIGVFDKIFVRDLPSTHLRMFLVCSLIGKENSDHKIKVSIKNSGGQEILINAPELSTKMSPEGTGNITLDLVNLPLNLTGEYTVSLIEEGKPLGKTTFDVIRVKEKNEYGKPN